MLEDTEATISCVVKGLSKQLDAVAWQKSDGSQITPSGGFDEYKIDQGTYDDGSGSQTTILTVPAVANSADSVYSCVITSEEHSKTAETTSVNSKVFSKY